jgi:hypothetical protein
MYTTTLKQVTEYFRYMDKKDSLDKTIILGLVRDLPDNDFDLLATKYWRYYLKILNTVYGTNYKHI